MEHNRILLCRRDLLREKYEKTFRANCDRITWRVKPSAMSASKLLFTTTPLLLFPLFISHHPQTGHIQERTVSNYTATIKPYSITDYSTAIHNVKCCAENKSTSVENMLVNFLRKRHVCPRTRADLQFWPYARSLLTIPAPSSMHQCHLVWLRVWFGQLDSFACLVCAGSFALSFQSVSRLARSLSCRKSSSNCCSFCIQSF